MLDNFGTKSKSYDYLVGGFNPSEKYWSVGIILPIYGKNWKNKIHVPNHQPDMYHCYLPDSKGKTPKRPKRVVSCSLKP